MIRVADVSWVHNKAVIEAAVLIVLALAGLLVVRQMHRVSAVSPQGQAHSLNVSSSARSARDNSSTQTPESSAPAEDFSNDNSGGQTSSNNRTSLTVNGQPVDMPQNGRLNQTIINEDGSTTTINTQSQNSASGDASNSNHSSVNINVDSQSSSQGGGL